MNKQYHDDQYLKLMRHVLKNGVRKPNRTGVDTISTFGMEMRFDLSDGSIPLLTTKKMHTKSIVHELLWFLSGSTDNNLLNEKGVTIWNEWQKPDGNLPKVYGYQWRHWPGYELIEVDYLPDDPDSFDVEAHEKHPHDVLISGTVKLKFFDQIANLIEQIRTNPDSRRLIVSAWNVADIDDMALPPCHAFFQFYVANGKLSCKLTQRSADVFLGVPFNISQYSILLHMIAKITGLQPGEFIWSGGDVHLYVNHFNQCDTQLSRNPYSSPRLVIDGEQKEIEDFKYEDFRIEGYECHPTIKADVAV